MARRDRDPMADSFRRWGYLEAGLDSLGRLEPFPHPDLHAYPEEAAAAWRRIYCGAIGVEFMHIPYPERCDWIAERMEAPPPEPDRRRILSLLARAGLFESFMHARYVGTKRYSLEGAAALIPLLDEALDAASGAGAEICMLSMSHRGRLNVIAHIVGIPPSEIFAGFEDIDPRSVLGGGDVKYHMGATGEFHTASGRSIRVHLVSNPSHLEAVDSVAMGRTRARQARAGLDGTRRVLPVTLHGDGAFAGQGIAAETVNMADLPGYRVGGTLRVVVNNLIGFTTAPGSLHSSRFASEMAIRNPVPIFHVNGQEPEAVVRAARLAADYRTAFASDAIIDLIGFRRFGHSEVDDPTVTQPALYRRIHELPMLWRLYAKRIGAGEETEAALEKEISESLQQELDRGRKFTERPMFRTMPSYWDPFRGGAYDASFEVDTAVPAPTLAEIGERLASWPADFHPHPKVQRLLEHRRAMSAGRAPIDWSVAEALAFGSLLLENVPVRLSGEDSRRGTFNQRHAVIVDVETGVEHCTLCHLDADQERAEVLDSPLSEAAVLGFEYGYSRDYPEALVCWEAQFGDFANGAQVILDQFVASGEDKWGLLSGLVLLLPHGYEGQGAEHSSARLERFLELAAEDNIQVCFPSTASQYFHLLRRQALRTWRKPLVVMTPKGMLRAPAASSPIEEFAEGRFRTVIADGAIEAAERVIVCSGKIAHELAAERNRRGESATAILRLEQLYPFPEGDLRETLSLGSAARHVVWVQEEPANMGALRYVRPLLQAVVDRIYGSGARQVTTVKRSASASPATGSSKAHALEQQSLLDLVFRIR
jgi:2-oxoglutarate dehydrogenase E1 component